MASGVTKMELSSKERRTRLHTVHRYAGFPQHEAAPRRTHHFPQHLTLQSMGGGTPILPGGIIEKKKSADHRKRRASPILSIRKLWPKPAATSSTFNRNSLGCGQTTSTRGSLNNLAEKSSSPSSPNSTSTRCTNSIWDTTASPSINFCSKSAHGS